MNRIQELEVELEHHRDYEAYLKEPHYCDECGKKIDKYYLPSNFCKKCVNDYVDSVIIDNCKFGLT